MSKASRSGLVSLGASLCLVACVEPDAPPYAHDDVKPIAGVADLAIDDGGQVQLEPGSGIGVGVEYTEGGQWSVTVTCDTQVTVQRCYYDVLVSTDDDAGITAFEAVDLESEDELSAPDDFAVSAELHTGDLAAALGTPILAVADGVVVFAGLGQRSPGLPDDHWQHD